MVPEAPKTTPPYSHSIVNPCAAAQAQQGLRTVFGLLVPTHVPTDGLAFAQSIQVVSSRIMLLHARSIATKPAAPTCLVGARTFPACRAPPAMGRKVSRLTRPDGIDDGLSPHSDGISDDPFPRADGIRGGANVMG